MNNALPDLNNNGKLKDIKDFINDNKNYVEYNKN